ncbi:MAG: DOPA 4,5-dioxygenase family protein [Acetobacteraceae bacterium]
MMPDFTDPAAITDYHAHIYYTEATRAAAASLREGMGARFVARLGRWHDEAVGPHPVSMYQVAFAAAEFPRLVPWLMLNRAGLSILVHPMSGDAYLDHSRFALWLGKPQKLRLAVLKHESEAPGA